MKVEFLFYKVWSYSWLDIGYVYDEYIFLQTHTVITVVFASLLNVFLGKKYIFCE